MPNNHRPNTSLRETQLMRKDHQPKEESRMTSTTTTTLEQD